MRIASIAARTVRWPIAGTGAARGRRERAAVILEVRSDGGIVGLGEAAPLPGMSVDTLADAERAIAAFARRAPFTIEDRDDVFALAAGAPAAARFAIETALLDALAREAGVSLARLLGETSEPWAAGAVRAPLSGVVDDVEEARRAVAAGISCLKIKIAPTARASGRDDDLRVVREIAMAVPMARLRLDANRGWARAEVAARLAELARMAFACGACIEYVEEPCPDAHLVLGDELALPLALDESLIRLSPAELEAALRSPGLAALVLKPTVLGGLSEVCRMFALARQHRVGAVMSHGLEGPIAMAACAELALLYEAAWTDSAATEGRTDAPRPVGLAAHPGLAGWRVEVPQLAADHVHAVAAPGLGFVGLDLEGVVQACGEAA